MPSLGATANQLEIPMVEDAAEAIGVTVAGRPAGSFGKLACFSFNGNKTITCGGGGVIVTDDDDLAARARHLTTQAKADTAEYIHDELGYNYRLTNIQAAVGCAQMESLTEKIRSKRRIAGTYRDLLLTVPGVSEIGPDANVGSTFWLYTIRVNPALFGHDSRTLMRYLRERGIESRPLWQPMHLSPVHASSSFVPFECGNSERLYHECLSLPSTSSLTAQDQLRVIDSIMSLGPGRSSDKA